jgi:type I restriction enzyme R subunit
VSYQSELQLENSMVAQLEAQGWKRIVLDDYEDLENNFREQFNIFNLRVLGGTVLYDDEFRAVRAHISNSGVFESAKILRDAQLLTRDDGTIIHYSLFNTKEWCKNRFQVAQQVKTTGDKWNNRYDVTLLINGLPLIQLELKRNGVEINEAFNQICRYKRDNAYKGLFNFIQFFIVSNGVHTRYFANNEKELSNAFAFKWTDEKNNQYKSLSEFTSNFLD